MARTALVTGATRGIGRELVRQMTALGYSVFGTGRDTALLEALKSETGCLGETADLTEPAQVVEIYAKAQAALGQVDVLVNNAGLNHVKAPVSEIGLDDWELQYAVNLRAPMLLSREALKEMGNRGAGHIVNVVSTIAKTSQPNYSIYSTMKYGFMGFTKCLIKEGREKNVKVTAVYPGGTDTDFRPEERPEYLSPVSAAKMIVHCITAPDDVVVHDLTYRPMMESNF
ncbi:3-oxoacyl-[acyl-carrier-protein] reductase FabG [Pontiella desulfatans]|uniref:3-oxoacyl-[acyl-carrier-protein] reductase FabG n=1 Tax=Pontiella desulfatans TaxID=2750659 RepID=A0A6C2U1F0_PONDE|nr:SDR family oxidoreductase [Pontiella desulfatans]VGO13798.1 3-oxoacyl-[acyl-carrier-protein] reductase FabG [Pontiella desulfatans]